LNDFPHYITVDNHFFPFKKAFFGTMSPERLFEISAEGGSKHRLKLAGPEKFINDVAPFHNLISYQIKKRTKAHAY